MLMQRLLYMWECVCQEPNLFTHAVDAIGPQEVHGLLDQVRPAAVEHPEAQVLQKLGLRGGCIQLSCGTETILCSADGNDRSITVIRSELISEMDFEICFSQLKHLVF